MANIKHPSRWLTILARHLCSINRLFLFTVVLPFVIAVVYFGFLATDVYVSESSFVVRTPQRQTSLGIGALLQGAGFSKAQDDTEAVQDYMLSRDALLQLNQQLDIAKMFGNGSIDRLSRYSGLDDDHSFEALHRYYQKHVEVEVDSTSSISTLSVHAFSAEDAYRINVSLLDMAEKLVNKMNERARQDMIHFAQEEVATAEQKAKSAALALSGYRSQQAVVDPEKQSVLQLQQISKLQDEVFATQTQLAEVRRSTPGNPQISAWEQRIQTLQAMISSETAKVVGHGASLTNKASEFQRLEIEGEFAGKQLAAALASLEQARNDAVRQQLYLERISQPNLPDIAVEPRRARSILATLVIASIAWGILTILIAGIREHHD